MAGGCIPKPIRIKRGFDSRLYPSVNADDIVFPFHTSAIMEVGQNDKPPPRLSQIRFSRLATPDAFYPMTAYAIASQILRFTTRALKKLALTVPYRLAMV
jgi:hypothetical protein